MYVIKTVRHSARDGFQASSTQTLHEMSASEFKHQTLKHGIDSSVSFTKVSAERAHRFVRQGGVHETALWVDDSNRIRRAG